MVRATRMDKTEMTLLHLGCGPIHLPGWVNIDKEWKHNPDIQMDYLKLSDVFQSCSVDHIFSCHSIEHLAWPDGVIKFLRATLVALRRGGVLRLVVPDLMKVAKLYVAGDDLKGIYDGPYHEGPDCPATRFMYFCRAWEHTVLFDEQLLSMLMSEAGYVQIGRMSFGQSDIPELCNIDRFESESLSIEGMKP